MELLTRLRALDAYPKLNEEFKVKTFGGAIVSVIAVCVICLLFVSELRLFLSVDTVDHLYVDVSRGEKLRINFDVTFPYIPCSLLSVDAMDVSGSHQLDVSAHIKKVPLGEDGSPVGEEELHSMEAAVEQHDDGNHNQQQQRARHAAGVTPGGINVSLADIQNPSYCGPCYGAESYSGQCCRTCDDVKEQYRVRGWAMPVLSTVEQCVASGQTVDPAVADLANHRGCRMYGYLEVNKVAGNFHFAPGKSFQHQHMHVHDLAAYQQQLFNVSHRIDSLSFGEPFPGQVNPLDNVNKPHPALDPQSRLPVAESGGMFLYYIKSQLTAHRLGAWTSTITQAAHRSHRSVTEHYRTTNPKEGQGLPGVFFFYELSPIMVHRAETRMGVFHFVTQLCAILGGVFTVAGMVDRLVYSSLKSWEKKLSLNKLS